MAYALVGALGLDLSKRHNALYGIDAVVVVLLYMCKYGMTACMASADMKNMLGLEHVPSSQWLLGMLRKVDPDVIERACQRSLRRTVRAAIKDRLMQSRGVVTAIDFCLKPYTGKTRDGNVIPGKPKGGTSRFEGYSTLLAVGQPGLLTLAVLRVVEGMTKADCVLFLLSEMRKLGITARVHLLDREFCTVAVMAALESRKGRFLMAIAKNAKIARAVAARKRGELGKVSNYTMKSDSGETFTFKLVIIKKMVKVKVNGKEVRCWKYLTFATNMPTRMLNAELDKLVDLYAKRWRIENSYKSIESCRARTHSRNHAIRTFLFFFSLIECNLWYLSNLRIKRAATRSKGRGLRHIALLIFVGEMMNIVLDILRPGKDGTRHLECVK